MAAAAQYYPNVGAANNANVLKESVELFVSCRDLVQKDFASKSDPFVVIYLKSNDKFKEIGRTEVIYDNHDPNFSQQFRLDYYFEQQQILRFDVFDEDKKGSQKLSDHDVLGSCTMNLGEIVHEPGCVMAKKLMHRGKLVKNKKSKKLSHLIATVEKVNCKGNQLVTLQFSCKGLPKMDGLFGKSDPYFLIERTREDGKKVTVYGNRDHHIKRNLNPRFKPFKIETQTLCNNDEYRPIIISLYDWDKNGSDDFIGSIETSLYELKTKPQSMAIKRQSHKKKMKKYGELNVVQCSSTDLSGFLDYLEGTLDLSLMVAIDFTGSNGDPRDHQSLHHFTERQPSDYQRSIRQIGGILSAYDSDQKYPVWGFGGHFNNVLIGGTEYWNGVKHDFNLNFDPRDPEVVGIMGIESAYVSALKQNVFALSGPTIFAPILSKSKRIARFAHSQLSNGSKIQYFILLILTDGIITDMKQTKDEIVAISNEHLPLSIVIVGIGNADFSAMDELDGDDHGLMNSKGEYAKRDVVQFVPYNKYKHNINELSRETLAEIPTQFLSYVRHHKIPPGERVIRKAETMEERFAFTEEKGDDGLISRNETLQSQGSMYFKDNCDWDTVPLPAGWERAYDEKGKAYYVDNVSQRTQWRHPSAAK